MDDFWETFANTYVVESAIDQVLQGKNLGGPETVSLQDLTDRGRMANALPPPYDAGRRVAFIANVGSVLTYENVPGDSIEGTIIKVKSGGEKTTSSGDGLVFVQWDDGRFRPIFAEHLRPGSSNQRMARNVAIRVADFGMMGQFFSPHTAGDELVHKATKDLWSFRKDDGGYVIERLFDSTGTPLKV